MSNQQDESKNVKGLALQSNSFKVPEGSFERLDNCTIVQDDIIQKRRGSSLFKDIGASVEGRNLGAYQSKLIGFCDDVIQVYTQATDGSYVSTASLGGAAFTIDEGTKARNVESNGNKYFTAEEGIYKLESVTANVLESGIDPATDLQIFSLANSATETFFRPDSQIAYRVLFGRKDANANTVIGAPSQLVSSTNSVISAAAALAVTTVTVTSAGHGLSVNDVIYVVNADSTGIPDDNYTVAGVPDANHFTFSSNSGSMGTELSYGVYKIPTLDFALPSGVTSEFFYRVYRSDASAAEDIPPDESTLQLVEEQNLTSGQITTGFIIYVDETPDILRQQYLYTNPNTGEPRGIGEANEKPPKSKDIALFKQHVFFANVETPYAITLNLLASNSTDFPNDAEFKITQGAAVDTYIGKLEPRVGNRTVDATSVGFVLAVVTITYNGHGFSSGDTIAIAQALDSGGAQLATLPQGNYVVTVLGANSFTITAPGTPTGLVSVSFAGVKTAADKRIFYIEDSAVTTVGSALDGTARAIVRAVNRDASAPCFAYYTSTSDGVPGRMVFRSKEVTDTFHFNAITTAIVESFSPNLPTSGSDAEATRSDGQGVLYFSKPNEPEAVPLLNQIPIGSKAAAILRIAPLRDSLIILKEDGCFRLNGDNYSNFVVTVLDSTIKMLADDSLAILDNNVYCMADQGIVAISETTAQIVSRAIEPVFTSIAGVADMSELTHAFGYETERLYVIATISATSDETNKVWVYNHLTNAWSSWNSQLFLDGFINPIDNKLYHLDLDNTIFRERKNQNKLDFTSLSYAGVVVSVGDNTAVINFTGSDGNIDDIVEFNSVINRITNRSGSGATAEYTFFNEVSFEAADNVVLYTQIVSEIKTSPNYGGKLSQLKQFSELQANVRGKGAFSTATVYFNNDTGYSDSTNWETELTSGGWGGEPWGATPWGDSDGIDINFETDQAQPLRMYLPLDVQRTTFIQMTMIHKVAGESIMMQNIAWTSRMYKQRTTK